MFNWLSLDNLCISFLFFSVTEPLTFITLKGLEGGGQFERPCGFLKNVSSKTVEPCFIVTCSIIISHNFPQNLIEISQVVQKIQRLCLSILAIFINFHHIF